jgi:hypothetical protein
MLGGAATAVPSSVNVPPTVSAPFTARFATGLGVLGVTSVVRNAPTQNGPPAGTMIGYECVVEPLFSVTRHAVDAAPLAS